MCILRQTTRQTRRQTCLLTPPLAGVSKHTLRRLWAWALRQRRVCVGAGVTGPLPSANTLGGCELVFRGAQSPNSEWGGGPLYSLGFYGILFSCISRFAKQVPRSKHRRCNGGGLKGRRLGPEFMGSQQRTEATVDWQPERYPGEDCTFLFLGADYVAKSIAVRDRADR